MIESKNYRARVLLVDDDLSNLLVLQKILEQEAYQVVTAKAAADALLIFKKQEVDIILSDLRMPGMSGLELLRAIRVLSSTVPFLILTAFGTVNDAVEAMKLGAVDFISKPVKRASVLKILQDVLAKEKKFNVGDDKESIKFLGQSQPMQEIKRTIKMLAPTSASVFIQGESGTGKELVAKLIHKESQRTGAIVSINCGAIPESLLESELFGYERGAFTGATIAKKGLLEAADQGTLFLDEVGEMPLSLQVKLLRVLEGGSFHRLGSTQEKKVDVRIISATNADIQKKISIGEFREDLFFRLNVVHLSLVPLRERGDDIKILADRFLSESKRLYNRPALVFSTEALETFLLYPWPGNIRELKNVIERAVVLTTADVISLADLRLPKDFKCNGAITAAEKNLGRDLVFPIGTSLREVEKIMIAKTLEATGGDKNLAAKLLGVNLRTIYRKIQDSQLES